MGREIRKVPADWQHPPSDSYRGGEHKPLHYGAGGRFERAADEWLLACDKWRAGDRPDYAGADAPTYYWDWDGAPPSAEDYMLVGVLDAQCTHFMLYESTSEGTPLSPAFATIEDVARYAAEHCSTFADFKATYDDWLRMLQPGALVATHIGHGIIAL